MAEATKVLVAGRGMLAGKPKKMANDLMVTGMHALPYDPEISKFIQNSCKEALKKRGKT